MLPNIFRADRDASEAADPLNTIPLSFAEKSALQKSIMKLDYDRMMDLVSLAQSRAGEPVPSYINH